MVQPNLLRIYVDADVLFRAATASHEYTAALVVLRMAEFTLLDTVTAAYTVDEVVRNLRKRLPAQEPTLLQFLARAVRTMDDPPPQLLNTYRDQAHWKDVINLAAAVHAQASVLVTYNLGDYYPRPGVIRVMTPGQLVSFTRELLFQTLKIAS